MPGLRRQKYWSPVGRVDNVYGDRNLFCSCVPMSAYALEATPVAAPRGRAAVRPASADHTISIPPSSSSDCPVMPSDSAEPR
jgi:hypothetical protein